jgi:7-cyano-7-deazaguanine synthase
MNDKAIALMSGGPDSFAAAAWSDQSGYETTGLFFDVGHEVAQREQELVYKQTDYLDINQETLTLHDLPVALSDGIEHEHFFKGHGLNLFPFSAGITLSIAISYAATRDIDTIIIGLHEEDFKKSEEYSPEVLQQISDAANEGKSNISVEIPFSDVSKSDIIKKCREWKLPIAMSWSCTQNSLSHCGKCVQCTERAAVLNDVCMNTVDEENNSTNYTGK